ncbi:hypothetical protein RI367_008824 [Sorochytrium milnesiophthora]
MTQPRQSKIWDHFRVDDAITPQAIQGHNEYMRPAVPFEVRASRELQNINKRLLQWIVSAAYHSTPFISRKFNLTDRRRRK